MVFNLMGIKKLFIYTVLITLGLSSALPESVLAAKKKSCKQHLGSNKKSKKNKKRKSQKASQLKVPYSHYKKLNSKVLARLKKTKNKPSSIAKTLEFISSDFNKRGFLLSSYDVVYLEKIILNHFQSFSGSELSTIFIFYARIKFSPSPAVLKALMPRIEKTLHTFSAQSLVELYFNFAKLKIHPTDRFTSNWFKAIQDKNLNKKDLVMATYAFALFGLLKDDRVEPFFRTVKHKFKHTNYADFPSFGLIANYYRYVLKEPNHYLSHFDKPIVVYASSKKSRLEERFSELLDLSNRDYQYEYVTQLGTSVHFFIPADNIIYQVDGPTHFILNTKNQPLQQRPKDIFMDEIHEALGYRVYRKPFYEIEEEYIKLQQK